MGEIHPRVRNNLQIISSLISLQRSVLDDRDSIDVLYDIGARIQSIAIVHDLLYRSASLHRLSFDEFLRELLRHLVGTLPSGKMPPSIELSAGSVELHVGTAVPLGLLVNEILATLLRNTRQEETLDVRLHQADGTVVFEARHSRASVRRPRGDSE